MYFLFNRCFYVVNLKDTTLSKFWRLLSKLSLLSRFMFWSATNLEKVTYFWIYEAKKWFPINTCIGWNSNPGPGFLGIDAHLGIIFKNTLINRLFSKLLFFIIYTCFQIEIKGSPFKSEHFLCDFNFSKWNTCYSKEW